MAANSLLRTLAFTGLVMEPATLGAGEDCATRLSRTTAAPLKIQQSRRQDLGHTFAPSTKAAAADTPSSGAPSTVVTRRATWTVVATMAPRLGPRARCGSSSPNSSDLQWRAASLACDLHFATTRGGRARKRYRAVMTIL